MLPLPLPEQRPDVIKSEWGGSKNGVHCWLDGSAGILPASQAGARRRTPVAHLQSYPQRPLWTSIPVIRTTG